MIDNSWKYFSIAELFTLKKGKRLTKPNMTLGKTPFIGAVDSNNGWTEFIDEEPIHSGNTITVNYNGSVADAYYQPHPFWASDDVNVLYPKFPLTRNIGLFICTIIKKEKYRFNFGRKWHLDRMREANILLPAIGNRPDFHFMEEFIANLSKNIISENNITILNSVSAAKIDLDISKWKVFKYGGKDGVFVIKNGYYNKKPEHTTSGEIPFIGATMFNNGVTDRFCLYDIEATNKSSDGGAHGIEQKIFPGNCVTVANNGAGVGSAFYQTQNFTCSHDVNVLYIKDREWNKYIGLFICTLIKMEKYRWDYGRKWRPSRMPESEIRLPVDKKGKPDWDFMEKYIKSLPYSASI